MPTLIAHKSHLKGCNVSYVRLPRVNLSTKELLDRVSGQASCPIARGVLTCALGLIVKQIALELSNGKSVDIEGLGKFSPAIRGSLKGGQLSPKCLGKRSVAFSAASAVKEAVDNLRIDAVVEENAAPSITKIEALEPLAATPYAASDALTIRKGDQAMLAVKGERLKVTGVCNSPLKEGVPIAEEAGLYLVPKISGKGVKETKAYRVPCIFTNTPKLLEFALPKELASGIDYRLKIATGYSGGGKCRYLKRLYSLGTVRLE